MKMRRHRGIRDIEAGLRKLDFDESNGTRWPTAVMMIAALRVGARDARVAEYTGLPRHFVSARGKRLRDEGIWTRDGKTACSWFEDDDDPGAGTMEFLLDVLVAEGLLSKKVAV